jgi:hypothetical protein
MRGRPAAAPPPPRRRPPWRPPWRPPPQHNLARWCAERRPYRPTTHRRRRRPRRSEERVVVATDTGDLLLLEAGELKCALAASPADGASIDSIVAYSKGFVCGAGEP